MPIRRQIICEKIPNKILTCIIQRKQLAEHVLGISKSLIFCGPGKATLIQIGFRSFLPDNSDTNSVNFWITASQGMARNVWKWRYFSYPLVGQRWLYLTNQKNTWKIFTAQRWQSQHNSAYKIVLSAAIMHQFCKLFSVYSKPNYC